MSSIAGSASIRLQLLGIMGDEAYLVQHNIIMIDIDIPNIPEIDPTLCRLQQEVVNRPISREEVILALQRAKIKKAVGIDNIPVEILKNEQMTDVLVSLFNKCFTSGMIPMAWTKSLINPVPKAGDMRYTSNYRGISVTASMYKVYCSVLNERLNTWAEEMGFLNEEQNGFRKSRSCVDHISSITTIIESMKSQKRSIYCAFVDFRQAYDSIRRDLLWKKMSRYGLNTEGKFLRAFQGLYASVQSAFRINGQVGEWFDVSVGLKQGDITSCSLFNIFLNDLINDINSLDKGIPCGRRKVSMFCYADDIVLMAAN